MSWGNKMYEAESLGALPPGTYDAVIAKVELQVYDDAEYVNMQFKTPKGSAFEKFYTKNANPKAVSAGYGKMKSLAMACGWQPNEERRTLVRGHEEFADPRQLLGESVAITVTETEANGKTYTNVGGFRAVSYGDAGGQPYSTKADDISGGSEPFRGQF